MNNDRRTTAKACIMFLEEGHEWGEISDRAHEALTGLIGDLQREEFWQRQRQEKHRGKNATTDKQLAICDVALPALEAAAKALEKGNYTLVVKHLHIAVETDGTPKATPTTRKRKARA